MIAELLHKDFKKALKVKSVLMKEYKNVEKKLEEANDAELNSLLSDKKILGYANDFADKNLVRAIENAMIFEIQQSIDKLKNLPYTNAEFALQFKQGFLRDKLYEFKDSLLYGYYADISKFCDGYYLDLEAIHNYDFFAILTARQIKKEVIASLKIEEKINLMLDSIKVLATEFNTAHIGQLKLTKDEDYKFKITTEL